jgi:hypothetical protein
MYKVMGTVSWTPTVNEGNSSEISILTLSVST